MTTQGTGPRQVNGAVPSAAASWRGGAVQAAKESNWLKPATAEPQLEPQLEPETEPETGPHIKPQRRTDTNEHAHAMALQPLLVRQCRVKFS